MGMGTFEVRICLHVRIDDPGFFDGRRVSEDLEGYVEEKDEGCQRESAHGLCHHHGGEDPDESKALIRLLSKIRKDRVVHNAI